MCKAKKRVLIITYYWIPSGGAGVQRWLKFVKYLRDFGWEPIVYAPKNADYAIVDHSFEEDIPQDIEVLKHRIWEPYGLFHKLSGKDSKTMQAGFIDENKEKNWKDKLAIWIRGNFLIPDPRVFWVRPSIKFLSEYIRNHPVDAVISTGPPHSMHLIALGVKRKFPAIQWLADFRDPWTNIDFYADLHPGFLADKIHHALEELVVQKADQVVVVTPGHAKEYSVLCPKSIAMITNGYDAADIQSTQMPLDDKFTITHTGSLNEARNPLVLWQALSELCQEIPGFSSKLQIQLIGKVDFSIFDSIEKLGLGAQMVKIDYLPHAEAIAKQQSSQLLLLVVNNVANAKGILPGKLFEYMGVRRPIVAIGPSDGDAAKIIEDSSSGVIVDYEDVRTMKTYISEYYQQYQTIGINVSNQDTAQYTRKALAGKIAGLLDEMVKQTGNIN